MFYMIFAASALLNEEWAEKTVSISHAMILNFSVSTANFICNN